MGQHDTATVLIVEDERQLADTYADWLSTECGTVMTAYSGEDALEMLTEEVDVVLLDRRLPGMTGTEVLEAIHDRRLRPRVAMLTAVDPDFDILELAFDDYIVKPVLRDDLQRIVDRLLTLATYDTNVQDSFALASKLSALERQKTTVELEANEEYVEYRKQLSALRDRIDDTLAEFEGIDFATAYRDLDRDEE